jgi:hypothetical protein
MSKRSDIEKQIAVLQAELDGADTDDEIWIKDPSGHEIKVSGKRATAVLGKYSKLWETEDEDGEDEEEPEEIEPDPQPKSKDSFFKGKGR